MKTKQEQILRCALSLALVRIISNAKQNLRFFLCQMDITEPVRKRIILFVSNLDGQFKSTEHSSSSLAAEQQVAVSLAASLNSLTVSILVGTKVSVCHFHTSRSITVSGMILKQTPESA